MQRHPLPRHLPLATAAVPLRVSLVQMPMVHGVVDVSLSSAWWRTRSLAAPGLAHAVIDCVRNGLLAGL